MDKQEKTAIAVSNTQRFKIGRPDYKAVDGRTYQLDRKTPSGKACIKTCAIRLVRDRPSLMERIIGEYMLAYDETLRRYFNTEEVLWEMFQEKFPEKVAEERITSYGELLYRAKHRR